MIERRHTDGARHSLAVYSPCETYRYGLRRTWDDAAPTLLFVMLNPSTADELRNDPTIERCERRAHALGFGTVAIANLFAYRATDPSVLKQAKHPIGPDNDAMLLDWHQQADMTLIAWGVHGTHRNRHSEALHLLTGPLHHLGRTKAGLPRHPLYVSYTQKPEDWPR